MFSILQYPESPNMSIEVVELGNKDVASHSIPSLPATGTSDSQPSPEGDGISESLEGSFSSNIALHLPEELDCAQKIYIKLLVRTSNSRPSNRKTVLWPRTSLFRLNQLLLVGILHKEWARSTLGMYRLNAKQWESTMLSNREATTF